MGIEALLQQLAEGKITKEQFLAELKKLLESGVIKQEEHDEAAKKATENNGGGNGGGTGGLTLEQVQKMIQSESDKVRTEYSTKLKAAQDELDKLKTDKMSAEELAAHQAKQLAEREAKLLEREVALHTVDQLREKQLPLEFRDILAGATVEQTDERIKAFATQWQLALDNAVNARFKEIGGDPGKGKGGGSDTKKWSEMTLTEQGNLYKTDKEKAVKLAAAEGIKLP